jgi:acyl-CoA synthetase (AMP-forming)/AMP-acid ligase II
VKSRSPLIDGLLAMLERESAGGARSICFVDESGQEKVMRYGELVQLALTMSAALVALGARENELVLLALPAGAEHASAMLGCVLAGTLPCTVPAPGKRFNPQSDESVDAVCRLYAPKWVVTSDAAREPMAARLAGVRVVGVAELWQAGTCGAKPRISDKGLFDAHHVQLTSGSLSLPKAAVLSHQNVHDNARGIAGAVGYDPARGDATLSWLPLHHDMGLLTFLSSIHSSGSLTLMQPMSFIRHPLGWLKRIAAMRATTTAGPTFALRYCVRRFNAAAMQGVDLSCCRNIFIGAERVDERTVREFADTFAPYGLRGSALQPCYGMAEATLAVTMHDATRHARPEALDYVIADRLDALASRSGDDSHDGDDDNRVQPNPSRQQHVVLSVGKPIPGMAYEVRDRAGRLTAERVPGEIFIRGTSVMMGYLASERVPVPAPFDEGGWLATGDIGYVSRGELFILGRRKEIIIIRGTNYFPHEIEEVVADHPAVFKGACAALGVYDEDAGTENLVLLVEASAANAHGDTRAAIQARLQTRLGYCAHEVVFVEPGALPRTTSGKLKRLKARELHCEGRFAAATTVEHTA